MLITSGCEGHSGGALCSGEARAHTRSALRLAAALLLALVGGTITRAHAQEIQVAEADALRGPRFLYAEVPGKSRAVPIDVARTPVLVRKIALDLQGVPVREALAAIAAQSGINLIYERDLVPAGGQVRLRAEEITVAAALTDVLLDSGLDVVFTRSGSAALVRRPAGVAPPMVGTVTGVVTEAATGNAVPQAQVSVQGTSLGRATDQDGRYTISGVIAGARTVTVRRLGYDPQSREVVVPEGGSVEADFALAGASTRLAEIVTTVTGAQRRAEVGHVIAVIKADSLVESAGVTGFGDLMQGRAAGVFSFQERGRVGTSPTIRIRGLNSQLVSNEPMILIDGIRLDATNAGGGLGGGTTQVGGYSGRLGDVNPDEIASIEVVKGPSAATLYGTDAANGVVVITTKRGRAGRAQITAFVEQGLLRQGLDYDDQFPDGYYTFGRNITTNAPQRCPLQLQAAGTCVADSMSVFNTFKDPDTRPIGTGLRQQYGLQISGGIGATTYFLSGDYDAELSAWKLPPADERWVRAQGTTTIPGYMRRPNTSDKLNLRANLTTPLGARGSSTVTTAFISNNLLTPGFNFAGIGGQVGYRDQNDGWAVPSTFPRPAQAFATRGTDDVRRFLGSVALSRQWADWLAVRGTAGVDLASNTYGVVIRRGEGLPNFITGLRQVSNASVARYNLDAGATATRALSAAWTSKTSLGVQYNRRNERGSAVRVQNLPLGGETLAGGTFVSASEATVASAVAGGFVEEMMSWRDRLFTTAALRLDGGSAFGEAFSVAAYPKASVSYVVGRLPGVSMLRLRAAYGASGVQPGPTDALSRVVVATGLNLSGVGTGPTATLSGGNPDLRPERVSEVEAGIDADLFGDRAHVELTAYQRTSSDALISRPVAPGVGGTRIENLGSARNSGIEAMVSAALLSQTFIAAGFSVNVLVNRNKLLRLGEGVVASSPLSEFFRLEEGYPIRGIWGFTIESFNDANGNGMIEASEVTMSSQANFIGPNFPTREATVAPYVQLPRYGLGLTALLQYRGDFYRFNQLLFGGCRPQTSSCRFTNDITTRLEDQAKTATTRSGVWMQDASFLVFRELSISYTLPEQFARAVRANAGHLSLSGRNLALLWKASTAQFEAASSGDNALSASNAAPVPSTYALFRLQLTF